MTDLRGIDDPFEVELERVVRHVRRLTVSSDAGEPIAAVQGLVQRLADAHADAAGLPHRPVFDGRGGDVSADRLAEMLRAVAFDADAVTDVGPFARDVAEVRRLLGAHRRR